MTMPKTTDADRPSCQRCGKPAYWTYRAHRKTPGCAGGGMITAHHDLTCGHWERASFCVVTGPCVPRTNRDPEFDRLIAVTAWFFSLPPFHVRPKLASQSS